ncbi:CCAAT binding transcription factor component, partial [Protomyces lactucae-debilis]
MEDSTNQFIFGNVARGLDGSHRATLQAYWQDMIRDIETRDHDFKTHALPLARIKKVMKSDEEVKMIAAEAPILFAKGCEIFITELTMRAWIHAEENKRRTLQRSDIANAISRSDMFDFLIDIVPR